MAQRFPALSRGDFNPASASTAGGFDDCICAKHAGDAESIDCADRVKLPAVKPYAVLCLVPSERVSICDRATHPIHSNEIMRLQSGNEHAKIFYGNGSCSPDAEAGCVAMPVRGRTQAAGSTVCRISTSGGSALRGRWTPVRDQPPCRGAFLSRSMLAPSGCLSHGRLPPDTGLP